MKALVTGGAGFIGSNIVDALLERGDEVVVVDDLSTGRESNLDGAKQAGAVLRVQDIRDGDALKAIFAEERPDVIFHLAAQIDVRKSIEDPAWDSSINVTGTINVLEAARAADVKRVVNTSTGGAIYGDTEHIPTPETADPQPMAAYGQSKFCAERYVGWEHRLYGRSGVTLRYGNVYGPRQDPLGEAGVIAIFCGKIATGGRPTIYGDGTQTRDYVYVGDVVAANLAAAASDVVGEVNIGTGRETSVLDIVDALKAAAPDKADGFEPVLEDGRLGEVQRSCLDVTKAQQELGWTASVDIRDGLARTLRSAEG